MTAILDRPPAEHTHARRSVGQGAVRFGDVLRAEWAKARTVPSTWWTLLVAAVLTVGLSALISGVTAHAWGRGEADVRARWDPTRISTSGGSIGQLALAILAAMLMTAEYATRSIRTTLVAVPRRGWLLGAKASVAAAVAFGVGEVLTWVSFFIGQALISGHAPTAGLGQPHVVRALVGAGLYLILISLLGLGLGTLLRSTAGAISTLVAVLYVLPGMAAILPTASQRAIEKYWPTQAGQQIVAVLPDPHALSAWAGLAVMAAFVGTVLIAAFVSLNRRDA